MSAAGSSAFDPSEDSLENLRKLVAVREELEVIAVRELARLPAARLEAPLGGLLEPMRKAARARDYPAFQRMDRTMHERIIRLSGVPLLPALWATVWQELLGFHRSSLRIYWPDLRVLMEEHEYLVRSILSGDAVAAEDGIRHHLQAIWYRIAEKRCGFQQSDDPLQRAVAYLCFHFHRQVRLAFVARKIAFASEGHLSKLFLARYGLSFQAYLQKLRLEKASDLLARSSLSVTLVAHRCGYQDVSRFGQHFRRKYAASPLQWRRRHQEA